ncbi:hypothetical protein LRA02_02340 [Lentilactobacillus rapi]|uniref:Uncharacterized protein n=1 Tax=Lentilactobacillus rapi TaxID=481723 RepID=A0A512PJJ1_9LACO|nr:hypothetical protein [Lentilactobacillus rapi]GEP71366.1 hypothetical protein LRA02_02340 [Lentilactobacillus rapi]
MKHQALVNACKKIGVSQKILGGMLGIAKLALEVLKMAIGIQTQNWLQTIHSYFKRALKKLFSDIFSLFNETKRIKGKRAIE